MLKKNRRRPSPGGVTRKRKMPPVRLRGPLGVGATRLGLKTLLRAAVRKESGRRHERSSTARKRLECQIASGPWPPRRGTLRRWHRLPGTLGRRQLQLDRTTIRRSRRRKNRLRNRENKSRLCCLEGPPQRVTNAWSGSRSERRILRRSLPRQKLQRRKWRN